jgi:DNA-binding NarL/FixJ family response regulator
VHRQRALDYTPAIAQVRGHVTAGHQLLGQSRLVVCMGSRLALTLFIAACPAVPLLVGAATTEAEGLRQLEQQQADVLICTDRLEQGNGGCLVAAAKRLRKPPSTLMVVTQPRRLMAIHQALQANCDGICLESQLGFGTVLNAIRTMQSGAVYIDSNLSRSYFQNLGGSGGGSPLAELTPREVDILQLMADGIENQAIAKQLHVSVETVKDHVRHILSKLNARGRLQAAVQGIRLGLVEWPESR